MNSHPINLFKYYRRETINVSIGNSGIGGNNPIRIQSMTTSDTMDTTSTVNESIRMINSGCEFVRITAPSIREAKNLINIKKELKNKGYNIPIIADIHFTPNAAEIAARIVEKVRINPGNYADKKKFHKIEYDDNSYNQEIERIYERVSPLIKICKEYGTAIRIGTNHGSLSDRIMSRFGDTPLGMVESALEYLRICEDLNYYKELLKNFTSKKMVCTNPDLIVNRGKKREYCAGSVAMIFEKIGGEVVYFGKPYPEVYNQSIGSNKKKIIAIGDNLNTDIRGAINMNYDSLIITEGIHKEEIKKEGIERVLKNYNTIATFSQSELKW